MARYIVKPRVVELYEIEKVRTILLYKTYEISIRVENLLRSLIVELKDAQVGDFLCVDNKNIMKSYIKKDDLIYFTEVD